MTRGIRNNNPLNLRKGSPWLGLSVNQTDPAFCQFSSVNYGVRAAFCVLRTYAYKHKLGTLEDVVSRFAPSSDGNDVERYCYLIRKFAQTHVSQSSALRSKFQSIDFNDKTLLWNRWLNRKCPSELTRLLVCMMALVESNCVLDKSTISTAICLL